MKSPTPDGASLLAETLKRLPDVLGTIASAPSSARGGVLGATHAIIRRQSSRPWLVEVDRAVEGFAIRTAGNRIILGEGDFGGMLSTVMGQLETTDDRPTAELYARLGSLSERRRRALDLLMALFLAHEFLHVEQQLGSDQYLDSDAYSDAVAAVDYQADVAAVAYVAALPLGAGLTGHEFLTLLVTLHVLVVGAFAPKVSRDAFDRLLVWHLQAARIARAATAPAMSHPALSQRPTVSLPQFRGVAGDDLTEADFGARRNDVSGSKLDIVLAAADGSGVLKLFRLAATDGERVRRLAAAILGRRLGEVRRELEEFFLTHSASMEFTRPDPALAMLEAVVAAGYGLLDGNRSALSVDAEDVCDFMEKVEFLIATLPRQHVDRSLKGYREAWSSGWRQPVAELVEAAGGRGRAAERARSTALAGEVRRITIRLSQMLLGDEA